MKKQFSSVRKYKNKLNEKNVSSITDTLFTFNRGKHFSFQTSIRQKRTGKNLLSESMHLTVKHRFDMNDYYANSCVQEANGLVKSQEELRPMYIQNVEEQIKSTKNKIKKEKGRLTTLLKIKDSFIKGKPSFNKTSPEQKMGRFFVVQFKKQTDLYENAYLFEHQYLDEKIAFQKSQIGRLTHRLHRLEQRHKNLKKNTRSVVFGTKELFKKQHTVHEYSSNHEKWKDEFHHARYNQMLISGRKDAKYGNYVFSYNVETKTLTFQTIDGSVVTIPDLTFPYGQKEVEKTIEYQLNCKDKKKSGKPISWAIEDHGEYYIFKCIVDIEENPHKNYSRADGLLGVDCNFNHLAIANINAKGQLIKAFDLSFDIENKSSGQVTKIAESIAIRLVDLAVKLNKPIGVEKLDTTKAKVSNRYGNKKANKKMSLFAYRKLLDAIKNRAEKMGIAVFEVNPAYTSQIGKMKYMKRFGISIHQSAAYVIARRAMGFKEKLPPVLYSLLPEKMVGLHHWTHWKSSMSLLSGIRVHAFYQAELFDLDKFLATSELFALGALTDLEQKGLSKIKRPVRAS